MVGLRGLGLDTLDDPHLLSLSQVFAHRLVPRWRRRGAPGQPANSRRERETSPVKRPCIDRAGTAASAAAHRSPIRHVAMFLEEPDAGNLHVRICGGPGPTRGYPTCFLTSDLSPGGSNRRRSLVRAAGLEPARG